VGPLKLVRYVRGKNHDQDALNINCLDQAAQHIIKPSMRIKRVRYDEVLPFLQQY
jgi:hypothetical protein